MWKVVFPHKLFQELNDFLFSIAPSENGCFLLANSFKTKEGRPVLTVTRILKPDNNSWNSYGEHLLEPNSAYINKCVVCADNINESLIFVHTHPNNLHPLGFSAIDVKSNKKIFNNLTQILINRPLGSLVFSRHGIHGVVFNDGKLQPVSYVGIVGSTIVEIPTVADKKKICTIEPVFDRQIKVIGKEGQLRLQEMRITIVGVGGTGSSVAVQLARMGVKKLTLIDKDILDSSNVSRVYGSKKSDIGKPKVKVLKKYLTGFSNVEIDTLQSDIVRENIIAGLIDADVIFGCTDNLSSRSILNDVSIQYYIPLIDIGCRINLNTDKTINQVVAKVQSVTPTHACLWCTGTLDGKIILQESLSDEEKKKLAHEGYYEDIEKQPSIISLTTMAASIGVNKLLGLIGIFGEDYSSQTLIELKNGFMIDNTPLINPDCICQRRRGKADNQKII